VFSDRDYGSRQKQWFAGTVPITSFGNQAATPHEKVGESNRVQPEHKTHRNHKDTQHMTDDTGHSDGEREVDREEYGYFIAACPECGYEFRARSKERLWKFIDGHLEYCEEFDPIKIRMIGYTRNRIAEYNADFQSERSDRFLSALNRQKTNIVVLSPEEAQAVITEFGEYDSSMRSWMTAASDMALNRVQNEIIDAMRERGYERENGKFVAAEK